MSDRRSAVVTKWWSTLTHEGQAEEGRNMKSSKKKFRNPIITFDEGWREIKTRAIDTILKRMCEGDMVNPSERVLSVSDKIAVYCTCYDMCTQRSGDKKLSSDLYDRHRETMEDFLSGTVLPSLKEKIAAACEVESSSEAIGSGNSDSSYSLLTELQLRWNNHQIMNRWLMELFAYLDRYHVKVNNLPKLSQSGILAFKTQVFESIKVHSTQAILKVIIDDRESSRPVGVDCAELLKKSVALYEAMGMGSLEAYKSDLEVPLLDATRAYYEKKRNEWMAAASTPTEYLERAERVLGEERTRIRAHLHPISEEKILRVCEEELLKKAQSALLEDGRGGCKALLAGDRWEDLRSMFQIFGRLEGGLPPMADILSKSILSLQQRPDRLDVDILHEKECSELTLLHEKYSRAVEAYFADHSLFHTAVDAALEQSMLDNRRGYYVKKREQWLLAFATPEYLLEAERALSEESARNLQHLKPSLARKLLRVCEEELLEKVKVSLLEGESGGCKDLLVNDESDSLRRMFRLFKRLENGLPLMAAIVKGVIISHGCKCTRERKHRLSGGEKDNDDDPKFINSLLAVYGTFARAVATYFDGHPLFQKALKDAFADIVNCNVGVHSSAVLMSKFCDRLLKRGGEKLSEIDVEETLEKLFQLVGCLSDKDIFADIYRIQLAKRLLNHRSIGYNMEKLTISKLEMLCGAQVTSKMEGMLSDLVKGKCQRDDFDRETRRELGSLGLDFDCQLLTFGLWPTPAMPKVILPGTMYKCVTLFNEWHSKKHRGRKLIWAASLGHASVRATFGSGTYQLHVSTLQALALNVFNDGFKLSFKDIAERLNIEHNLLKPLMHSLSCGKHRVILKTPADEKINETDQFSANANFRTHLHNIRIPMANMVASHDTKRLHEDRLVVIEAAIVRILKSHKTIQHHDLIAQVLSQLAFCKPRPRVIKRCIENLIEREYFERCAKKKDVYNYLA